MTYKDTHYLWKVDDEDLIKTIQGEFSKMNTIYIADGHHRSASSYLLCKEEKENNPDHDGTEPYNFFMSYLIPESDLVIHEFNRLIEDLNGLTKEEFLVKLDENFRIRNRGNTPYTPTKQHHFSMYLDGDFYSLYLRKLRYDFKTSLDRLDAQILYKTILKPILNINDLRHDKRIGYFGMCPATVKQMTQIADEGLKMPPKSTYILPKLRSGITIYEF